jgi:predicted nuclease of predicted toxin-antitoxin system
MKALLDENLPKRLKSDLPQHKVFTVSEMKWNSKKNGELLRLMIENGFNVLITFDQNISHQQNFNRYPIAVIVLIERINTYDLLKRFVPEIATLLISPLPSGPHILR